MKKLVYPRVPIGSISALSGMLSTTPEELLEIANYRNRYIRPNTPEEKENGETRQTYTILPPLEPIQRRIKTYILDYVEYPEYLQGGIRDRENPRGFISNAKYHAGREVVICEDVADFFPSITDKLVMKMWQHFFCFPPDVASLLTRLTTYKGFVPQGARTSTHIANTVFWDIEPEVELKLRERDIRYSRFVDDITISLDRKITNSELKEITSLVYGMFFYARVKPKRKKRKIQKKGGAMRVHGLNIDGKRPTIPKKERNRIRASVKQLEDAAISGCDTEEYYEQYSSVLGRVANMKRLHEQAASKLEVRLERIKPIKS